MTGWDPGDGGREVLSYGGDEPPRRPPRLLVGVAVTALAVGVAAGLLSTEDRTPAAPAPRGEASRHETGIIRVAAGSVGRSAMGSDDAFWLTLFNGGQETIVVELSDLRGWPSDLTDVRATAIEARSWGVLRFSAPVTACHGPPGEVRVAVVRIAAQTGAVDRSVPLDETAADVLRHHHVTVCSSRRNALRERRRAAGVRRRP